MKGWLVSLLLAGCTFVDGEHFLSLEARAGGRWVVGAGRDAGDGWQRLNTELEVVLDELRVDVASLALLDVGGERLAFDPASPPPGYTLCHGGHCHAVDGSLVSYEEISAMLGGGEATPALELPVGELDLLVAGERELCDPTCHVDRPVTLGRARAQIRTLSLRGRVRDGLVPPRFEGEREFTIDVTPADLHMFGALDLEADGHGAPDASLLVQLVLDGGLFDDVDLGEGGALCPGAACDTVLGHLSELPLELTTTRP
jgi:hypothetical protein